MCAKSSEEAAFEDSLTEMVGMFNKAYLAPRQLALKRVVRNLKAKGCVER